MVLSLVLSLDILLFFVITYTKNLRIVIFSVNSTSRNTNNILYYRDLIEVIHQEGLIQCITSIGSRKCLYEFIQATYSNISNCSSPYREMLEK